MVTAFTGAIEIKIDSSLRMFVTYEAATDYRVVNMHDRRYFDGEQSTHYEKY